MVVIKVFVLLHALCYFKLHQRSSHICEGTGGCSEEARHCDLCYLISSYYEIKRAIIFHFSFNTEELNERQPKKIRYQVSWLGPG